MSIPTIIARKLLSGENWKSNGTVAGAKNLVTAVINKISYDPKKMGNIIII